MSKTFDSLGIPFPLFKAPIKNASQYQGDKFCNICAKQKDHCFHLGIGSDLIVDCKSCKTKIAIDADDREDAPCENCGSIISFPVQSDDELHACYDCLRTGTAAITQDTELGMIRFTDAQVGLTHGRPGPNNTDFDIVAGADGWNKFKLSSDDMMELVRTPSYITWQGESWLFCCHKPMVYIGEWGAQDFKHHAPDNDELAYFKKVVEGSSWMNFDNGIEGILRSGHIIVYVFECQICKKHRAGHDMD